MSAKTFQSDEVREFVFNIFMAAGSSEGEADIVSEHLVDANLVGHDSHGVIRVAHYLDWKSKGWIKANQEPKVVRDDGAIQIVDGGFGYGQAIARKALLLASERAKTSGICLVGMRNCSHVGRVGAWAEQMAELGLVSIHCVNSSGYSIRIAPFGGRERRFSTNPICIGAPIKGSHPVVLDMATAQIPEGKILVAINKGEQVPEGMILNGQGEPTCNPDGFFDEPQGAVLPIAGPKGSGLAFMIEVLAGSLTGGCSGHPRNLTANQVVNNMFSILIDPNQTIGRDAFSFDVERLIGWTKSSRPLSEDGEVLVPGEIERRNRKQRQLQGIPLDDLTLSELERAATKLELVIPEPFRSANS